MRYTMNMIVIIISVVLTGCGALEPKFYPEQQTITSKLFPTDKDEARDHDLEVKISELLSGHNVSKSATTTLKRSLVPDSGKLLIINNLSGIDTKYFDGFKKNIIEKSSLITDVEMIAVSALPNLNTLRMMGARQESKYVLILNSFSNVYRYHNGWTIPTIMGLGIPYFFLDTQTIKVFAKIEYSLIDIKNNVILSNESVTSEAESKAILPESGIIQYLTTNNAIAEGMERLGIIFIDRI